VATDASTSSGSAKAAARSRGLGWSVCVARWNFVLKSLEASATDMEATTLEWRTWKPTPLDSSQLVTAFMSSDLGAVSAATCCVVRNSP